MKTFQEFLNEAKNDTHTDAFNTIKKDYSPYSIGASHMSINKDDGGIYLFYTSSRERNEGIKTLKNMGIDVYKILKFGKMDSSNLYPFKIKIEK